MIQRQFLPRIAFVLSLLAARLAAQAPEAAETLFEVAVQGDVRVAARDGVKLALDLYLPVIPGAADRKLPALLCRTPYNKAGAAGEARWFAARGYAVVVNDTRGRYASEGEWRMIVDDPEDGFDVAAWVRAQTWSAGRIGTFGTSYVGGTTSHRPPPTPTSPPSSSTSTRRAPTTRSAST